MFVEGLRGLASQMTMGLEVAGDATSAGCARECSTEDAGLAAVNPASAGCCRVTFSSRFGMRQELSPKPGAATAQMDPAAVTVQLYQRRSWSVGERKWRDLSMEIIKERKRLWCSVVVGVDC